jgi:hypothetical protein
MLVSSQQVGGTVALLQRRIRMQRLWGLMDQEFASSLLLCFGFFHFSGYSPAL